MVPKPESSPSAKKVSAPADGIAGSGSVSHEPGTVWQVRAPEGELLLFLIVECCDDPQDVPLPFVRAVALTDHLSLTDVGDAIAILDQTGEVLAAHCWLEGPVALSALAQCLGRVCPDSTGAVAKARMLRHIQPRDRVVRAFRCSLYQQFDPVFSACWEKLYAELNAEEVAQDDTASIPSDVMATAARVASELVRIMWRPRYFGGRIVRAAADTGALSEDFRRRFARRSEWRFETGETASIKIQLSQRWIAMVDIRADEQALRSIATVRLGGREASLAEQTDPFRWVVPVGPTTDPRLQSALLEEALTITLSDGTTIVVEGNASHDSADDARPT